MDPEFWKSAWKEGRTNFHQREFNDKLLEYFPRLNTEKGQRVLVPLCGKSKDLLWLHGLDLHVRGIELHDPAVESFFAENELSPVQKSQDQNFAHYTHKNIVISCGDFFKFGETVAYDFVYDRAALVALPASMRKNYAQVIKQSLKKGGKCLLLTFEYDQSKLDGPPFSVGDSEIHELYENQFAIKLMESNRPENEGPRLATLENLNQNVYILEKLR